MIRARTEAFPDARPGSAGRLARAPAHGEAYRFGLGGCHGIFSGATEEISMTGEVAATARHARRN